MNRKKKAIGIVVLCTIIVAMFGIINREHAKEPVWKRPTPLVYEVPAKQKEYEEIQLDSGAVYEGDLILVNNKVAYEFWNNEALVPVYDYKSEHYFVKDREVLLNGVVCEKLNEMLDAYYAKVGQKEVNIISGYRSEEHQQKVYNQYASQKGEVYAMNYVAIPGYSEHHTGLAMDLGLYDGKTGTSQSFDGKGNIRWIRENAYRFGFVLRYPEDKENITGIKYEPWHYRYVGIPHAYIMEGKNLCLEEYLEYMKDYSFDGNHLNIEFEGKQYEIYYEEGETIHVPKGKKYSVSGDNKEGFVVTVIKE